MRGALNNLLDWTVGDRQAWMEGLLRKIEKIGKGFIVPTTITRESTDDESSIELVHNENKSEAAPSLAVDRTPGKECEERKQ